MIAVSKRPRWAAPVVALLVTLWIVVMALGGVAWGATTTTAPVATTTTTLAGVTTSVLQPPASSSSTDSNATETTATPEGSSTGSAVAGPSLSAPAAFLIDEDTGRVIYSHNANVRRQIASTTKIMTCIVALESLPLDKVVTASKRAEATNESQLGLKAGQQFTVEQLLYALMVKSANDAGVVLAEASAGTVEAFVDKMNAKAADLGLKNTHFTNPHGLDNGGYKAGYSSAGDLATLAQYAMKNAEFRKLVGTVDWSITMPGDTKPQTFRNHNELLGAVSWVTGIKTGFTSQAGFCLVASGTSKGVSLIGVILGEKTQPPCWADSKTLLEFGFSQYEQVLLADQGVPTADLSLPYRSDEKLELVTERSAAATVFKGDTVTSKVNVASNLVLPVQAGQVFGTVQFSVGDRQVASVNLVAARSVQKVTLGLKLAYFWHRLASWLGG